MDENNNQEIVPNCDLSKDNLEDRDALEINFESTKFTDEKSLQLTDCNDNLLSKKSCFKCGASLGMEDGFCSKCGAKVEQGNSEAVAIAESDNNKRGKSKLIIGVIVASVVTVVTLIVLVCVFVLPNCFMDVDDYLAQGNYEKAYEIAETNTEKDKVKFENIVAYLSVQLTDYLKNPSSFSLRKAYKSGNSLVMQFNGTNSFGGSVTTYCLYNWKSEDSEWQLFREVSDLEDDEIKSYDSTSSRTDKAFDNIARVFIRDVIDDGVELSSEGIKRINNLYESDALNDIDLI
jgi:ribosomal protein L40E